MGRTPVIRRKLSREHLSAISAVSMTGELYLPAQDHSYKGADIFSFLEQLLEEIEGRLLVIWDGAPVHRSRAVKEWLSQGAAQRIQLEQFPGYAPELNPDEGGVALPETGGIEEPGLCRPGTVGAGVLGGSREVSEQARGAALLYQDCLFSSMHGGID